MPTPHNDPTLQNAIREEIRERGCWCCVKNKPVLDVKRCSVGKQFPACRYEANGFVYDEGES